MTTGSANVAVVTGASSGIGRATAEEFARRGWSLAVVARRKELLEGLVSELRTKHPSGRFEPYACDISNWDQVSAVAARIGTDFGHVNVLINNAGAFDYQSLEKSSVAKIDELVNVNVRGTIYVSKAFLGPLKQGITQGAWAKIVSVSSISGLWGFANMSAYTATKFAVAGFSSALRRELKPLGIRVATIFPGPVNTKLPKGKRPDKKFVMIPEDVAPQIFDLATSEKRSQVSHPVFLGLQYLENLSPDSVDKLLKKIL